MLHQAGVDDMEALMSNVDMALSHEPNAELYCIKGNYLYKNMQYQNALTVFNHLLQLDSNDYGAIIMRANSH